MESKPWKTKYRFQETNLRKSRLLTWALLIVLSNLAVWQAPTRTVQGQASRSLRFTESLRLQEVEPGIEYGQMTSGQASKDELTGPWLINVLRIDLKRATLKIVHALDEGVSRKLSVRWRPDMARLRPQTVDTLGRLELIEVSQSGCWFLITS
jgi:hypothetical protein